MGSNSTNKLDVLVDISTQIEKFIEMGGKVSTIRQLIDEIDGVSNTHSEPIPSSMRAYNEHGEWGDVPSHPGTGWN